MNTGRGIAEDEDEFSFDQEDIWSLDNLENLIDLNISGCRSDEPRLDFADSVNMNPEVGGGFLHASCVAVKKMILFANEVVKHEILHF